MSRIVETLQYIYWVILVSLDHQTMWLSPFIFSRTEDQTIASYLWTEKKDTNIIQFVTNITKSSGDHK